MDPVSIYQMGRLRQQEILAQAAQQQGGKCARQYISEVGSLLVHVGQRLVDTANHSPAISQQPSPECC